MSKWEKVKLGQVCNILSGYAFDSKFFSDNPEGKPLIRIRDLMRGYSNTFTSETYDNKYVVKNGDLLIGMDGQFNIAPWKGEDALLNQRVCKIWPSGNNLIQRFLLYFLPKALKDIELGTSYVTVKHLSVNSVKEILMPLPPLETQRKIAKTLDTVSELLAMLKQQLAELDNLIKSTFYDMFGDPGSNAQGWNSKTLQQLLNDGLIIGHLDGNHGSLYPKSAEFVEHGVPYIGANSIVRNTVDLSKAKFLTKDRASQIKKGLAKDGDVLFAHNATVGPVAILKTREESIVLSTSLTYYRCCPDLLNNCYLMCYMQTSYFVSQYTRAMAQTTRNQVPITEQRKLCFIVPPFNLQEQFSKIVIKVEKQKALVSMSVNETQCLLDSLMSKYFD